MKEIKCKNGGGIFVDEKVYDYLNKFVWRTDKRAIGPTYYYTIILSKKVYAHRLIVGLFGGFVVDHLDRDSKNHCLQNLEITDQSGNIHNSLRTRKSKYRGVTKYRNKWRACIQHNGKYYRSGGHDTEESAARKYDELAKEVSKNKSVLNFPEASNE